MLKRFFKNNKDNNDRLALIKRINFRNVRYVIKRSHEDYSEEIIGRDGYININDNELIICCDNEIVFRNSLERTSIWELLSLEGVTMTPEGSDYSIVAYYKYHR